ncbi:MAG: hypothetical protein KME20_13985 [Kaiparowitsia implicata GSE-PSE-MK54-09C]|jgi:F0F1-type ATP synthase delta subunit|nr:hypothetical protein [Kaiparowitsia implicata GSE-PSE-MK54-09C]
MELTGNSYPIRAFIRYQAKMHILKNCTDEIGCPALDEALFQELVKTLFQSSRGDAVYRAYAKREDAEAVEREIALEVASAYWQIQNQRQQPLVQRLNKLLQ